jgi:hypothetical protein
VGPRAVLDAVVKRKIPSPRREWNPKNPDRPARSPALYRLSYHGSFPLRRVKSKVVPVLFLTEHHAVKAYWGSGGIAPHIL